MNQKNTSKSDCSSEQSASTTSFKVKLSAAALKRQMNDSSNGTTKQANAKQQLQQQHAAVSVKRVKFDDDFLNPWRCDSDPYAPLQIKYHKPKYNPPCYFDENLKQLTKRERALKIMSYHYALNIELNVFQQAQAQNVLLGDPIQGSHLFNGCLEKKKTNNANSEIYNSDAVLDDDNTYISRSGRHVRRKRADLAGFDLSEDEDEKSSKRKRDDESPKATISSKRSQNNKKSTIDEIMARSALFADSPVVHKSARTETLFSKLVEAEKETKKAESEKTKFQMTLDSLSDEDCEMEITSSHSPQKVDTNDNQQQQQQQVEETFLKKRIVPPLPANRKGKNIPSTYTELPSTSSSGPNPNTKNSVAGSPSTSATTTPGKRGPKKKTTNCPICGLSFPTKDIEQHASTCGLTSELEIESSIPNQRTDASY